MVQELGRVALVEGFTEQPVLGLDSDALGFRAASELFAAIHLLRSRVIGRVFNALRLIEKWGAESNACWPPAARRAFSIPASR
jgi:hypothetical protein